MNKKLIVAAFAIFWSIPAVNFYREQYAEYRQKNKPMAVYVGSKYEISQYTYSERLVYEIHFDERLAYESLRTVHEVSDMEIVEAVFGKDRLAYMRQAGDVWSLSELQYLVLIKRVSLDKLVKSG